MQLTARPQVAGVCHRPADPGGIAGHRRPSADRDRVHRSIQRFGSGGMTRLNGKNGQLEVSPMTSTLTGLMLGPGPTPGCTLTDLAHFVRLLSQTGIDSGLPFPQGPPCGTSAQAPSGIARDLGTQATEAGHPSPRLNPLRGTEPVPKGGRGPTSCDRKSGHLVQVRSAARAFTDGPPSPTCCQVPIGLRYGYNTALLPRAQSSVKGQGVLGDPEVPSRHAHAFRGPPAGERPTPRRGSLRVLPEGFRARTRSS